MGEDGSRPKKVDGCALQNFSATEGNGARQEVTQRSGAKTLFPRGRCQNKPREWLVVPESCKANTNEVNHNCT